MINKLRKRVVSFVLLFAISATCLGGNNISVMAAEKPQKTNINYISTDLNHTEYTYDESGKSYKVVENTTEDLSTVYTKIYQLNEANEYTLIDDYVTNIVKEGNDIVITEVNDGVVDKEVLQGAIAPSSIEEAKNIYSVSAASSGTMLTDWKYYGKSKGTNKFAVRTLSVITSVLSALAAAKMTKTIPVLLTVACERIAQYIIDDNLQIVYWTQYVYYKYILNIDPTFERAEKNETFFYSDSSHDHFIDSTVDEYYVDGWY